MFGFEEDAETEKKRKHGELASAAVAIFRQSQQQLQEAFEDDDFIDHVDGRSFQRPGKSNREDKGRNVYAESVWGRMLANDLQQLRIFDSEEGDEFRKRFRLPFGLFEMLLEWYEDSMERAGTKIKETDCAGRSSIPTNLKLLGVLRIIGRGSCFDCIKELSGISESSMHTFFHSFTAWFVETVYPKVVKIPETEAEIASAMGPYSAVGLNGAICSTDAVHLHWSRCPSELANLHTGKEGYCTIAYNVSCGHDGYVFSSTPGTYGSCNDKTIIKFDDWIHRLRTDDLYTKIEYGLRNKRRNEVSEPVEENGVERVSGVYAIVDGGYHRWCTTMSAFRHISNKPYAEWREKMESVRKDIECVFGRVKGRFRILKMPILFQKKEQVDCMFLTCLGLHNMLHKWDGFDKWEAGVEWGEVDGFFDEREGRPFVKNSQGFYEHVEDGMDFSGLGRTTFAAHAVPVFGGPNDYVDISVDRLVQLHTETDLKFMELQNKLVLHHFIQKEDGKNRWLRS